MKITKELLLALNFTITNKCHRVGVTTFQYELEPSSEPMVLTFNFFDAGDYCEAYLSRGYNGQDYCFPNPFIDPEELLAFLRPFGIVFNGSSHELYQTIK